MINEVLAQAELLEYARHTDEPTYSAYGTWKGLFLPGPRSELVMIVDGSTGKVNSLTSRASPDQTTLEVTPGGPADVRAADATETLGWQSTKETRTSQTAFARWSASDDNATMPTTTDALEVGFGLGFQRVFHHDTVGFDIGGSYLRLERIAPPGVVDGSQLDHQLNPRATLTWVHDLSRKWSFNAQAGIVYVNPFGTDPYLAGQPPEQRAQPYPIFGALVAYTDIWGHATLSVGQAIAPNLFIAENTLTDNAILQAAVPLSWLDANPSAHDPKLALVGSVGVSRTELLDPTTAETLGSFDIERADIGFAWTPMPGQTYGLRFERLMQSGDAAASLIEPSFTRDTLFFTFSLRYPDDVTQRMPRTGQSYRSDRSDVAPVGTEPVVPDPVDPAPPDDQP